MHVKQIFILMLQRLKVQEYKPEEETIMRIKKIIIAIRVITVILVMLSVSVLVILWMMANGYGGKYPVEIIATISVVEGALICSLVPLLVFLEKERNKNKEQNEKNNQNENKE